MRLATRILATLIVATALVGTAPEAEAQALMGRVSVKIVDPDGNPLRDVTITVTSPALDTFEIVKTTNKKGSALIAIPDATQPYEISFDKPGYQGRTEPLKVAIGGTMGAEFTLGPAQAAAPEPGAEEGQMGGGPKPVRTYNEGVEAQRLGDLELAAAKYREAAELDPELAAAHTALAAVSLLQEDYATAAAEAEAALAIDPTDVRAMQLRFDAYRLLGDEAKAAEAADNLREIGDLGDAAARIFNEGVDAFNTGDTATAQSKFKQVVELDPSNVTAYVALAQVSLTQGAPAEALAMAQKALELEPDNVRAFKLAFDGARLSGDEAAARQALDRLVELDPDWLGSTVFDHAADLFNANEPAAAALELEYVVKARPELAKARFMYGVALYNTGQVEAGREQLEAFLELAPDDPDAEVARGLLEYQE